MDGWIDDDEDGGDSGGRRGGFGRRSEFNGGVMSVH
jgi:hypothetical protein